MFRESAQFMHACQSGGNIFGVQRSSREVDLYALPSYAAHHMMVAGAACGLLTCHGKERLSKLAEEELIHSSMIAGGTLASARLVYERYCQGVTSFTRDNYEQLGRVCSSAANLIKTGVQASFTTIIESF